MKKTRKMVASLVAIVICFAMLLGTTYAWFTDSVINTNNIIKSGNVDVELMHKSNDNSDYEVVTGTTKLFVNKSCNAILWEPEASAKETFAIKNVGSLALKYEFRIKALAKELNEKGNSLLDVITVTDANDNEIGFDKLYSGTILAGAEADPIVINLKWNQNSAVDNEYENLTLVLGVELLATQVSFEEDGTGTGFDDGVEFTNVSNEVDVTSGVTAPVSLTTSGENAVEVSLPADLVNALTGVNKISLVHTEPKVEGDKIIFDAIELVDQDGNVIDLSANDKPLKVTLPAQETFVEDTPVAIYHDGKQVATATVGANGVISYDVNHLCKVEVKLNGIKTDAELETALANGDTNLFLAEGTFHMPASAQGKTLTITGVGADTIIEVVPAHPGQGEANGQLDYSLDGSKVTFNDLTIKTNGQLYAGYARLSAIYNNCVIQNTYNCGVGTSEFNNCVFNITNEYLRVGGAYSATFKGCTFNTIGRAILVFQDGTNNAQKVLVEDCTFNASAAAYTWNGIHVAAVSIDGTNGTYEVSFKGNNVVGENFNGLYQIKTGAANVTFVAYDTAQLMEYLASPTLNSVIITLAGDLDLNEGTN